MDDRIAIDLRCGGLEDTDLQTLGEAEHVDRARDARFRCLNRVELVMDRRGWTGKVIDFVRFDKERKGHVVAQKLEKGLSRSSSMLRRVPVEKLSTQRIS